MAGEKYIVATAENPIQIAVRNILNPYGYTFLSTSNDSISLLRLIRSYQPDFIVADLSMQLRELRNTIETIDMEMLCACVVIGEYRDMEVTRFLEKSNALTFCPKPLNRDMLIHTVDMALINFRRVYGLSKKLRQVTEDLDTRKVVDKAKWILIERDNISESEAYEKIRKKSMDTRRSMKAIAEAIILTHDMGSKG